MRGRKPKPAELKRIEGNPGKRRLPRVLIEEGVGSPRGAMRKGGVPNAPLCPAWLNPSAKSEWHRVAPVLKRLGILHTTDRAALAGYCQAWARWRQAEKGLDVGLIIRTEHGAAQNPNAAVAVRYLEICRKFCVEFGMTPSSRGRMLIGDKEKDATEDPLEAILKTSRN